jgi:hypothetical protein
MLAGQDALDEPGGKRCDILSAHLAEAEHCANLRAVCLNGSPRPGIVEELVRIDGHLLGEVRHHRAGNLVSLLREATLVVEESQQRRKS